MAWMDLFRPKWKHSNHFVRQTAVEKLSDRAGAGGAKGGRHQRVLRRPRRR